MRRLRSKPHTIYHYNVTPIAHLPSNAYASVGELKVKGLKVKRGSVEAVRQEDSKWPNPLTLHAFHVSVQAKYGSNFCKYDLIARIPCAWIWQMRDSVSPNASAISR